MKTVETLYWNVFTEHGGTEARSFFLWFVRIERRDAEMERFYWWELNTEERSFLVVRKN